MIVGGRDGVWLGIQVTGSSALACSQGGISHSHSRRGFLNGRLSAQFNWKRRSRCRGSSMLDLYLWNGMENSTLISSHLLDFDSSA